MATILDTGMVNWLRCAVGAAIIVAKIRPDVIVVPGKPPKPPKPPKPDKPPK